MKRFKSVGLFLVMVWMAAAAHTAGAADGKETYIGSTDSKKYHLVSCEWVKKIDRENRVEFSSIEEAESQGFTECLVCTPKESLKQQRQKHSVASSGRLKARKPSAGMSLRDSLPGADEPPKEIPAPEESTASSP